MNKENFELLISKMNFLTHASSFNVLLSSRGNCPGLRTTRAERSGSWLQVRPTGSELQALTALARETSAQLASSRPASLVSPERPLLSKLPRWQIKDYQIADKASVFCPANTLTFITILFFFFFTGQRLGPNHVGAPHHTIGPHPGVFHVHGGEEEPLDHLGASGSDGFHQDLPRHKDVLLRQLHPPGQRPHWLLRLQPASRRLPHSCEKRAGLWPGDADPLDPRWSSLNFSFCSLVFTDGCLLDSAYCFVVIFFLRPQYFENVRIQRRQQRWGWPGCCWQVTKATSCDFSIYTLFMWILIVLSATSFFLFLSAPAKHVWINDMVFLGKDSVNSGSWQWLPLRCIFP